MSEYRHANEGGFYFAIRIICSRYFENRLLPSKTSYLVEAETLFHFFTHGRMTCRLRIQFTCCGHIEEILNCNGHAVGREIRKNLMETMAFELGIISKVCKNGEIV